MMPPECVKHPGPTLTSSLFRMFTGHIHPKYVTQKQRPSLKCESSDFPETQECLILLKPVLETHC